MWKFRVDGYNLEFDARTFTHARTPVLLWSNFQWGLTLKFLDLRLFKIKIIFSQIVDAFRKMSLLYHLKNIHILATGWNPTLDLLKCNMSRIMQKIGPKILLFHTKKKAWLASAHPILFKYDTDYKTKSVKTTKYNSIVGVIPKEGLVCISPSNPFLVWHRLKNKICEDNRVQFHSWCHSERRLGRAGARQTSFCITKIFKPDLAWRASPHWVECCVFLSLHHRS